MNRNVLFGALLVAIIVLGSFTYFTYGQGRLVVEITDPPEHWGQASNIYIHYSEVNIHRANAGNETGWFTAVKDDGWIDLSEVLNSSKSIGASSLRNGKYNLIRFEILDAIVTVGNNNYTASVASGRLNVAIAKGGANIAVGQTSHIVIDVTPKVLGSTTSGFRIVPAIKTNPS